MATSYKVRLTGLTPLLMHWDNLDWSERLVEWRLDPENNKKSKAGDDRTPAWGWIGNMYHDGTQVAIPSENLMACFMRGAAHVKVPGGRGQKTFKAQAMSGMGIKTPFTPVLVNGGTPIALDGIYPLLTKEQDFRKHLKAVEALGFSLFVKRASIEGKKHVRVRPRFDTWALVPEIEVWDEQITETALFDILGSSGKAAGLGDWRPGSKTPGPFGRFRAERA